MTGRSNGNRAENQEFCGSPDASGIFATLHREKTDSMIYSATEFIQRGIEQALRNGVTPEQIENEPHEYTGFSD